MDSNTAVVVPLSPNAVRLYLHLLSGGNTISFHRVTQLSLAVVSDALDELETKTDFRYPTLKPQRRSGGRNGEVHAR